MSSGATLVKQKITLRHARAQVGWTQEQLAEKAKLHASSISEFERGKRPVSLRSAYAILRAINKEREKIGLEPYQDDYRELDWTVTEE